jgi:hypothetical protein
LRGTITDAAFKTSRDDRRRTVTAMLRRNNRMRLYLFQVVAM